MGNEKVQRSTCVVRSAAVSSGPERSLGLSMVTGALGKCLFRCCFGAAPVSQSPLGGVGEAVERRSVIRKRRALPEEGLGCSLLGAPLLEELAH
ncbi:hypothetical protein MHYP_G00198480 [Metynnis hypsauchen]